MKIATIIARTLLGLIFVVFGSNMFLHFIPMPPPPEGPARDFMTALFVSHLRDGSQAARHRASHRSSISGKAGMQVSPGALLVFEPNLPAWGNVLVSLAW